MKKIFLIMMMLAMPFFAHAQEKKTAIYFYADWCPHCQKVNAYFTQQGFYDTYNIQKMNFDDPQNKALLGQLFAAAGKTSGAGIPAILVDNTMLVGDQQIIGNFKSTIDKAKNTTVQVLNDVQDGQEIPITIPEVQTVKKSPDVPLFVLLGAAFVDASNPCALAVLILLLATVIAAKGKNRALLSGFMFSLAIFLSYFLMGIGIYKAIGAAGVSNYISLGVGVLAIIIALANFKDVFWYGKGFIMEVPLSWRPKMQAIIRRATSPWSAFLIGFAVSLFLVPCASGPYVVILGMLAQKVDTIKATSLLVLYNFVFVLPMILITLGMYFFNTKLSKLEKWRKENLRLLHAIAGTFMLVIGIYLIYVRH